MKTTKYMVMAAAAMAFAACSNEENVSDGPVEARVSASFGVESRAVDDTWAAGDAIGISVTRSTKDDSNMRDLYQNVKYTTKDGGSTATFAAETGKGIFFQDAEEKVTFSAYYPYSESLAGGGITINTKDNNASAEAQATIDYLFASGEEASKTDPTVEFSGDHKFKHCMAQLKLMIVVSTSDGFTTDEASSITNTSTPGTYKLGGLIHTGTFNTADGETSLSTTTVADWDITNLVHSDDESAYTRTYTLILLPQNQSKAAFPFTAVVGGQTYTNAKDINPNLEAGKKYTYTLTIKKSGIKVSGCTIADWDNGTEGGGDAKM